MHTGKRAGIFLCGLVGLGVALLTPRPVEAVTLIDTFPTPGSQDGWSADGAFVFNSGIEDHQPRNGNWLWVVDTRDDTYTVYVYAPGKYLGDLRPFDGGK